MIKDQQYGSGDPIRNRKPDNVQPTQLSERRPMGRGSLAVS